MKNKKLSSDLTAFLALLSGSIWLGAYILRMFISYILFDVDMNLVINPGVKNLSGYLLAFTPAVNTTFIVYVIFIITFTLFLITSTTSLKENGWLFIITLIVYITLPFEVYLMTIDYKIILQLDFAPAVDSNYIINLIRDRFVNLSSFPVIIILSYCSAYFFLIFKPLMRKKTDEN